MAEKGTRHEPGKGARRPAAGAESDVKAGVAAAREAEALTRRAAAKAKAAPAKKAAPPAAAASAPVKPPNPAKAKKSPSPSARKAGAPAKPPSAASPAPGAKAGAAVPPARPQASAPVLMAPAAKASPAKAAAFAKGFFAELGGRQRARLSTYADERLAAMRRAGDIALRLLDYVEADTAAAYEALTTLASARTFGEALEAQRALARFRLGAWRAEAVELGEAGLVAAREAAAPVTRQVSRFVTLTATPLAP
ncbi:MAG: phasin family protein [Alphaproteobacteria bacterium]|nr:phasin family protein [Alphaproteobacteria bacterium]